jgi:outer membrane murein-binding lipoprotein Lpp
MNGNLKKDLNLFSAMSREKGLGAIDFEKTLKKCLLVFAAVFAVVLLITLGVNGARKHKIEKLNSQIEALQADLEEIDQYKQESEQLQRDIDKFNEAIAEFNVSQRLTTEDIKNVAKCMPAGIKLTSFSYTGDTIVLGVTGTTELMIADFANSLRNAVTIDKNATTEEGWTKPNFKSVLYTGVTKSGDTYTGTISITMNEIEPEVVEEEPVEETSEAQ